MWFVKVEAFSSDANESCFGALEDCLYKEIYVNVDEIDALYHIEEDKYGIHLKSDLYLALTEDSYKKIKSWLT